MITNITVENFKSFIDETSISLSNFNIFIGENGSGKSSIFQILSLISQKVEVKPHPDDILSDGQLVRLGDFDALANNPKKPIVLAFSGNVHVEESELHSYFNHFNYFTRTEFSPEITYNRLILGVGNEHHSTNEDRKIFDLEWRPDYRHRI